MVECSAGLLVFPFDSEGLSVLPDNLRCSLGLEDGFHVGLCRPEEGDLVGEPAKARCSTGLEVGGVHRGERPSWQGSAFSSFFSNCLCRKEKKKKQTKKNGLIKR